MLKVTLVKSLIGNKPVNKKTAAALGLRKIGQSNIFEDTPSIRGMVHNVQHLVKVENVEGVEKVRRRRDPLAKLASGEAKAAPKAKAKAPKAEAKAEAPAKKAPAKKAAAKTSDDAPAEPKAKTAKKKSEE